MKSLQDSCQQSQSFLSKRLSFLWVLISSRTEPDVSRTPNIHVKQVKHRDLINPFRTDEPTYAWYAVGKLWWHMAEVAVPAWPLQANPGTVKTDRSTRRNFKYLLVFVSFLNCNEFSHTDIFNPKANHVSKSFLWCSLTNHGFFLFNWIKLGPRARIC